MSWTFVMWVTPPSRLKSSGATAQKPSFAKAACGVLDVLVDAPDLGQDQDDRSRRPRGRLRVVDGHLVGPDLDRRVARLQPGRVGLDGLGEHRIGGQAVAGGGHAPGAQHVAATQSLSGSVWHGVPPRYCVLTARTVRKPPSSSE